MIRSPHDRPLKDRVEEFLERREQPRISGEELAGECLCLFPAEVKCAAEHCLRCYRRSDMTAGDLRGVIWIELTKLFGRTKARDYTHVSDDNFARWLWVIVKRIAMRHLAREAVVRTRTTMQHHAVEPLAVDADPAGSLKLLELRRKVTRLVETHLRGERRVVMLVHLQTLDFEETARRCARRLETVKRYVREAGRVIIPLLD